MIECKSKWEILSFDGRVVQRFLSSGMSEHYHIDFLETVELDKDRKGRQYLKIKIKNRGSFRPSPSNQLAPEEIPQAQAFVDEINRVMVAR